MTEIRDAVQKHGAENEHSTQRLSWWKRRGEKTLYLTHSTPPAVGSKTNDGFIVTSIVRQSNTSTIYGFGIPCYEVRGKPQ